MYELESEIQARRMVADSDIFYDTGDTGTDDQYPEPAAAIRVRLARDFDSDIPEDLHPAFYHLSRINIGHDWDASRVTDRRRRRTARRDLLEKEDHVSVLRRRYCLKDAAVTVPTLMISFSRCRLRVAHRCGQFEG